MDHASWTKEYSKAIVELIPPNPTQDDAARAVKTLLQRGLIRYKDLSEDPKRFFDAHKLLVENGHVGPGFMVRTTVQLNLFGGSILGLGGEKQVALLDRLQESGDIGCFCLTETGAGVNSGLIVNTTAAWDPEKQKFLLNCADLAAEKNWISQGATASMAVVIASLLIDGTNRGPHAFLVRFRDRATGKFVPGIEVNPVGEKSVGTDLDNARIRFDNIELDPDSMLSKYARIEENTYVQTTKLRMNLGLIAQRLVTGRLVIAQTAILYGSKLFRDARTFAESKAVWTPPHAPKMTLAELPRLESLFTEAQQRFERLIAYTDVLEEQTTQNLIENALPTPAFTEKVSVAKIEGVETSIDLCHRLQQEMGSYALLRETGFENMLSLQFAKCVEGDSNILGLKLARDTFKLFKANKITDTKLTKSCMRLAEGMAKSNLPPVQAWNENWRLVYALAQDAQDFHIDSVLEKQRDATSKL